MISALIAEDSPTIAELLKHMLESDPGIRVVGTAADGEQAVAMTRELRPNVVVMDVHMPLVNGFEATQRIMTEMPTPIVIVSSTINVHETAVSMKALELGALALLEKPIGLTHPEFEDVCRRFVATVRALSAVKVVRRWTNTSSGLRRPSSRPALPMAEIVAVAASTGGPAALYRLLSSVPVDFDAPILVVQHMAPGFIDGFAEWLNSGTRLSVCVARHDQPLESGCVYIAPDDRQLGLVELSTIEVSAALPIDGFRPSGTHLFHSVALIYGRKALGIVLTGMGRDGVEGLRTLRASGGRVIAQDEATSIVFGMPGATVAAGLANEVLPLDAIGPRLGEWVSSRSRSVL
jgi:two-component system, chemotaxis family, protein-glutamate methylesterase/glutaminase